MKKFKKINILSVSLLLSLTIGSSSVFASGAPTAKQVAEDIEIKNEKIVKQLKVDPEVTFIYDDGNGNASFVPSELVKDKIAYENKLKRFSAQDNYNINLYDWKSAKYNGSDVYNTFDTNVYVEPGNGISRDYKITFSGTSYTAWTGSSPQSATKINQSDNFSYNYVGTSATISWPPGIGFTGGGSSASITYPELSNKWRYDHTYSGIVGKAYAITSATRSNMATYLFGTSTISVGTNDTETVW
ncbi:hypothetical protein [Paenibacillus tundrae]|uniref:hypothetical protein n=1 Tax=Paenibacillus tundrae TaxID=528187 RepID=UPI0022A98084|nr:hypothetical protein [Paenibacillus tundrae]MCZ1264254.1 hypothetical protein [Paenibacillus tundrae]